MIPRWAPLVHGRTYEVDYRPNLIVVPRDFNSELIQQMRVLIHGMSGASLTTSADRPPSWMAVKGSSYCIIGVMCLAHQVSADRNEDFVRRRTLPVFLGYVSKLPAPPLPARDLKLFGHLYKYIWDRWEEKPSQAANEPHYDDYKYELPEITHQQNRLLLNREQDVRALWGANLDDKLWSAISLLEREISLCLDFERQSDALKSPFLNATALDATDHIKVKVPVSRRVDPAPRPPIGPPLPPHRQTEEEESGPGLFGLIGSAISDFGGALGSLFGRGSRGDTHAGDRGSPKPDHEHGSRHGGRKQPPSDQPPAGFRRKAERGEAELGDASQRAKPPSAGIPYGFRKATESGASTAGDQHPPTGPVEPESPVRAATPEPAASPPAESLPATSDASQQSVPADSGQSHPSGEPATHSPPEEAPPQQSSPAPADEASPNDYRSPPS